MTDERKNKITFSVIATVVIALHVAIFVQGCGSASRRNRTGGQVAGAGANAYAVR